MTNTVPATERTVQTIYPYLDASGWVFDDAETGLEKEGLVEGIDTILEHLTSGIPNAADGFRCDVSAAPFDGAHARLEATGRTRDGWTEYRLAGTGMTGWLCPNLGLYFAEAPADLHVRVSAA